MHDGTPCIFYAHHNTCQLKPSYDCRPLTQGSQEKTMGLHVVVQKAVSKLTTAIPHHLCITAGLRGLLQHRSILETTPEGSLTDLLSDRSYPFLLTPTCHVISNRHSYDGSARTPALVRAAKQPFDAPQLRPGRLRGDPFSRNERISNWSIGALKHATWIALDPLTIKTSLMRGVYVLNRAEQGSAGSSTPQLRTNVQRKDALCEIQIANRARANMPIYCALHTFP